MAANRFNEDELRRKTVPVLRDMAKDEGYIKLSKLKKPQLIALLLDEGKDVVVALRDTAYEENDPYTIGERKQMFKEMFGDKVKVIVIPDIEEIVYGRGVGYGIREISLPAEIEAISATAIRKGGEK